MIRKKWTFCWCNGVENQLGEIIVAFFDLFAYTVKITTYYYSFRGQRTTRVYVALKQIWLINHYT